MAFLHYYKLHNVTRVIYHGTIYCQASIILQNTKSPISGNIIYEVLLEEVNYVG